MGQAGSHPHCPHRHRQRHNLLRQRLDVPGRLGRGMHGHGARRRLARKSLPHDEDLGPRLRVRQEMPRRQLASPPYRLRRPMAVSRDELRQRPRLGPRTGRAQVCSRSATGRQDSPYRLHRPQGPAHPPKDAQQRLRLGNGANAHQCDGLLLPQFPTRRSAAMHQPRCRRARHEVSRGRQDGS